MGIPWIHRDQSMNHHQDYYIFSRGSQPKPSFATGILGGGTTQGISVKKTSFGSECVEDDLFVIFLSMMIQPKW